MPNVPSQIVCFNILITALIWLTPYVSTNAHALNQWHIPHWRDEVKPISWDTVNKNIEGYSLGERLHYTEYDYLSSANGIDSKWGKLDSETGTLGGGGVAVNYQNSDYKIPFWLNIELNKTKGNTLYNGYLVYLSDMELIPFQGTTANTRQQLSIKAGYPISYKNKWLFTPYLQVGDHKWVRDLIDKKEEYSHQQYGVGIKAQYQLNLHWLLEGSLDYAQMTNANIKIPEYNFNESLGNKPIINAGIKASYRFQQPFAVFLAYDYHYYKYGKSASQSYLDLWQIYEPASISRVELFKVGLQYIY